MIARNSYRVLASYTYDHEEKPIRSGRIAAAAPSMTDTASDMESSAPDKISLPLPLRNISAVPEHDEFIQLMINGKALAGLQQSQAEITWRGYSTSIPPDFEMSKDNLRKALLSALQNIISLNETEQKADYYMVNLDIVFIGFKLFF